MVGRVLNTAMSWVRQNGSVLLSVCSLLVFVLYYSSYWFQLDLLRFFSSLLLFAMVGAVGFWVFIELRPKDAQRKLKEAIWNRYKRFLISRLAQFMLLNLIFAALTLYLTLLIARATELQATRLSDQNTLIQEQISESQKARIFSGYMAQLEPFLREVDRLRERDGVRWSENPFLASRIQGIVDSLPATQSNETVEQIRQRFSEDGQVYFSAERAHFFRLLVSMGYDFAQEGLTLDFSGSDFSGQLISMPNAQEELSKLDLGAINLSNSNFVNAKFENVIGARANFSGSYFLRESALYPIELWNNDARQYEHLGFERWKVGANLASIYFLESDRYLPNEPDPSTRPNFFQQAAQEFKIVDGRLVENPQATEPYFSRADRHGAMETAGLIQLWKIHAIEDPGTGLVKLRNAQTLDDLWRERNFAPNMIEGRIVTWPTATSPKTISDCAIGSKARDVTAMRDFFSAFIYYSDPRIQYLFPLLFNGLSEEERECYLTGLSDERPFPRTFLNDL